MTEEAIGLDRREKIDLQERLLALGHDLNGADGTFGAATRRAIGHWQDEKGLPATTFLTRKQYVALQLESDEAVKSYRARQAAGAETKPQDKATPQRVRKPAPVVRVKPRQEQRQAAKPRPPARPKRPAHHEGSATAKA